MFAVSQSWGERRLAGIVALDVAGYSARTEADEARTVADAAELRGAGEGIAARHARQVFNTACDGFMLEFGSSLAAVEAALFEPVSTGGRHQLIHFQPFPYWLGAGALPPMGPVPMMGPAKTRG
jgi:class 3 adenylate cyclase